MKTKTFFAAAALLGSLVATQAAFAADAVSYPRTVGTGENIEVIYGPAGERNVLGGGIVQLKLQGEESTATYQQTGASQQRADGVVPAFRGNGENLDVVYLPAAGQNG